MLQGAKFILYINIINVNDSKKCLSRIITTEIARFTVIHAYCSAKRRTYHFAELSPKTYLVKITSKIRTIST